MTQKRITHLHRLADILYRRNRGDSIRSIADHFGFSESWVSRELSRAKSSADIIAEAEGIRLLDCRQMMFDFMYEPL